MQGGKVKNGIWQLSLIDLQQLSSEAGTLRQIPEQDRGRVRHDLRIAEHKFDAASGTGGNHVERHRN